MKKLIIILTLVMCVACSNAEAIYHVRRYFIDQGFSSSHFNHVLLYVKDMDYENECTRLIESGNGRLLEFIPYDNLREFSFMKQNPMNNYEIEECVYSLRYDALGVGDEYFYSLRYDFIDDRYYFCDEYGNEVLKKIPKSRKIKAIEKMNKKINEFKKETGANNKAVVDFFEKEAKESRKVNDLE